LRTENNELRDEISHYDTELREVREQKFEITNNQTKSGIGSGVLIKRGSDSSNFGQKKMEEQFMNHNEMED